MRFSPGCGCCSTTPCPCAFTGGFPTTLDIAFSGFTHYLFTPLNGTTVTVNYFSAGTYGGGLWLVDGTTRAGGYNYGRIQFECSQKLNAAGTYGYMLQIISAYNDADSSYGANLYTQWTDAVLTPPTGYHGNVFQPTDCDPFDVTLDGFTGYEGSVFFLSFLSDTAGTAIVTE